MAEYLLFLNDTTLNPVANLVNDPDEEIQVILLRNIQYEQERSRALPALAHYISDVTAEEQSDQSMVGQLQKKKVVQDIKTTFFAKVTQ